MSRDVRQTHDQSAIDAALKSLASRPNVQSTLILSRKDGSIIRATGFPQTISNSGSGSQGYDSAQPSMVVATVGTDQPEGATDGSSLSHLEELTPSPAQRLASTIYEFVNISTKLAMDMTRSTALSPAEALYGAGSTSRDDKLDQPSDTNDDDVQLLRMRTKRSEIIIFPDANYLNCVVQNLSKSSSRAEPS